MSLTGIKTAPLITELTVNLEDFNKGIDNAIETATEGAKDIEKQWDNILGAGSKIKDFGESWTQNVSLPIAGVGTALGVMANNTENALSTLEARLGVTGEEAEKLKGVARTIYTDGFGESIDDVVDSLSVLEQGLSSTKNWTEETKTYITESIMAMGETFDQESNEIVRAIKVIQDSDLSDDVEHTMDVITRGFQLGSNYSEELLDTVMEYAPQFNKAGLSIDEAMNYLVTGANNGAYSVDKIGDAIKELNIRAIDGSETTAEGFRLIGLNAQEMAEEFAKGGENARIAFQKTLDGLASIEDPIKQEQAGVALMGTMWEDLGRDAVIALADVEGGLSDVDGANEKVLEKVKEQKEFTATWRELQDALMPIGTEIMKIAKDFLPEVKDAIGDLKDMISGLTDEQKENIVKWGALAVAVGPALQTIGGAVEVFGNVGKAFGTFNKSLSDTKGFDVAKGAVGGLVEKLGVAGASSGGASLAGSMTALALPAGLVGGALTVLGLAVKGTADYMTEEAIPAVDLFADETINSVHAYEDANGIWREQIGATRVVISDETKEILGAYMEMDKGIRGTMESWRIDSSLQTVEGLQEIQNKYSEMGLYLREQEQIKYEGMLEDTRQFLADNGALSAEDQAQVLERITQEHLDRQTAIQSNEAEITRIIQEGISQRGYLRDEDFARITELQNQQNQHAVETLSATEEECLVIEQRLKDERGRITAESASEMIQKANEARDGEIRAANEKYTETIKQAGRLKEAGAITDEQYQNMIDKAKETKDQQINKAEEACNGVKTKIQNATPGIESSVNMQTGKIMSAWDKVASWVTEKWQYINAKGKEIADMMTNNNYGGSGVADNWQRPQGAFYNGINYVPTDLYPALLHKGERVLTKEENERYTQQLQQNYNNSTKTEINMNGIYDPNEIGRVIEDKLFVLGLEG